MSEIDNIRARLAQGHDVRRDMTADITSLLAEVDRLTADVVEHEEGYAEILEALGDDRGENQDWILARIKRLTKIEAAAGGLINEGFSRGKDERHGWELGGERAYLCDATWFDQLAQAVDVPHAATNVAEISALFALVKDDVQGCSKGGVIIKSAHGEA